MENKDNNNIKIKIKLCFAVFLAFALGLSGHMFREKTRIALTINIDSKAKERLNELNETLTVKYFRDNGSEARFSDVENIKINENTTEYLFENSAFPATTMDLEEFEGEMYGLTIKESYDIPSAYKRTLNISANPIFREKFIFEFADNVSDEEKYINLTASAKEKKINSQLYFYSYSARLKPGDFINKNNEITIIYPKVHTILGIPLVLKSEIEISEELEIIEEKIIQDFNYDTSLKITKYTIAYKKDK